nr:YdcF family protein [Clostridia bacterium]
MAEIFFPSDTLRAITEFLFVKTDYTMSTPVDLAIVTGNEYINTVDEVYALYCQGLIRRYVLFTGCNPSGMGQPEADLFLERWVNLGGKKDIVILERRATNIKENMLFSYQVIHEIGGFQVDGGSILFVGKAFALRRILMSATAAGFPHAEKWQVYGTIDKLGLNIGPDCWWKSERSKKRVIEELERIARYSLSGDLSLL